MRTLAFALMLSAITSASAVSGLITFENDSVGFKPNGWSSVDSSILSFRDSQPTGGGDPRNGLEVNQYGLQSFGRGLAVYNDFDDSGLIIDVALGSRVTLLSLCFGNDDDRFRAAGAWARMLGFREGSLISESSVEMNGNDLMDQRIDVSDSVGFDQIAFKFDLPADQGLIEVVDNIAYTAVPEPATIAMLGVALTCLRRRR